MKVTRKMPNLGNLLAKHEDDGDELSPGLSLSHLPHEIEGMPHKGHFEAHIKGKVRRHTQTSEDGKTHHSYDLDVTHCECPGEAKKRPPSPKDSVDKAFARWRAEEAREPEHK